MVAARWPTLCNRDGRSASKSQQPLSGGIDHQLGDSVDAYPRDCRSPHPRAGGVPL